MKNYLIICLLTIFAVCLTACTPNTSNQTTLDKIKENLELEKLAYEEEAEKISKETETEIETEKEIVDEPTTPVVKNTTSFAEGAIWGTVESPIEMNEVGIIELYSTVTSDYEKAYLRVDEILSREKATKLFDDYNNADHIVKYEADPEQFNIHAVKVSVDLKDYQTPSYGTSRISPTFTVRSTDDTNTFGSIMLFSPIGIIEKVNPDDENYHQGDIVELYYIYALPKNFIGEHLIRIDNNYANTEHKYSYFTIDK